MRLGTGGYLPEQLLRESGNRVRSRRSSLASRTWRALSNAESTIWRRGCSACGICLLSRSWRSGMQRSITRTTNQEKNQHTPPFVDKIILNSILKSILKIHDPAIGIVMRNCCLRPMYADLNPAEDILLHIPSAVISTQIFGGRHEITTQKRFVPFAPHAVLVWRTWQRWSAFR